jgi:signal transduction histidine kinase
MYGMKWSNAQEENKEKYVNYIRQNQKQITEQWLSMVKKHHEQVASIIKPEVFQLLFDYLLDFGPDSKVNRQKLMASLPEYCRYLYEQGITSEKISIFMTVMRHLLMGNYDAVFKPFPIHVVKEVINRLDTLETEINRQYARLELIKRENDMTELHEDRLSLIGKMAASMAHEIRNPLTSIKGFLKLIRANIPSDASPNIEKYINIIESEFENIHMQITGLLSFSKKQIIEESFSYLSANQLLHSMISLLSPRLINENVELEVNEREVFHIHGQKVALQQVISNILNNGIDALAMNQDREKRMRIEIYSDDRASYISISNNGPEIPHEVRGVLFRPFTTTKEDGTGLGLAICKQIMEKNNGDISFESGPDETTFTLIFYKEEVRSEARVRVGPSRTAM